MKHYPARRNPARIEGVERTRAPYALPRWLVCLLLAATYAAGLVTGAILFGCAVLP